MLVKNGAEEKTRDKRGRPAQYYLDHPDDLALPTKAEPTSRNRQRQRRTPPKDHVRGRKPRENGAASGGGECCLGLRYFQQIASKLIRTEVES